MKSILLVDDDRDLIEIYTELLDQLGFSITSAPDGQEALALAPRLQLLADAQDDPMLASVA